MPTESQPDAVTVARRLADALERAGVPGTFIGWEESYKYGFQKPGPVRVVLARAKYSVESEDSSDAASPSATADVATGSAVSGVTIISHAAPSDQKRTPGSQSARPHYRDEVPVRRREAGAGPLRAAPDVLSQDGERAVVVDTDDVVTSAAVPSHGYRRPSGPTARLSGAASSPRSVDSTTRVSVLSTGSYARCSTFRCRSR
jgi:hypothetical protein